MLFNSFSFLIFFPIVTLLYFTFPKKTQWIILLIASCIFYMEFVPMYIFILFFLIGIDYFAGIKIEKSPKKKRKYFLLLSILANISVLFFFKYFNFFHENVAALAHVLDLQYPLPLLEILLPIGLSFHVFQSMGYIIEVYKKKQKAEKHLGYYALYVLFYPQLVAGPIERPQHLLPQLHKTHIFQHHDAIEGLKRIAFGFFKKVVIADRLALMVNEVYAHPREYDSSILLLATIGFAFQIYCDFSGYTDIALGSARVMGIRLRENFNNPYAATSIADFWRRWNMSLYTWFYDYIYIPLGGNRVIKLLHYRNILIVFLISGFWHGAKWTFITWGLLHGIFLTVYDLLKERKIIEYLKTSLPNPLFLFLGWATTFVLVCIGWIFFRAASISEAWYILTHILLGPFSVTKIIQENTLGLSLYELCIAGIALCFMGFYEWLLTTKKILRTHKVLQYMVQIILVLAILNFGISKKIPFIYFQF